MPEEKSLAELLLEYAISTGAKRINELPGLWINQVDEHWLIKCNGHEDVIDHVPPFSWSIEYNGWPAGIMHIRGDGFLCSGEMANEKTLIAAIGAKMQAQDANRQK